MPKKKPSSREELLAARLRKLQARCDRFNEAHPVGSQIWYHPVIGEPECAAYLTKTEAQILSGRAVGFVGCVALEAITNEWNVKGPQW